MVNFFKKNLFPIALFLITLLVFLANYKTGAFLVGWDNLFPEFNLKLNVGRDFFAVWQKYRGIGALDNFAQSSNLIHDLYRLILSVFLPLNLIRWIFVFLMFFIGGLGMYYLLRKITKIDLVAFLTAVFYQFNLGTIQQFFLPFEAFIIHFASLPWLFLTALNYLEKKNRKSLLLFFLTSLLALPQAFIPTLFAVYFSGVIIYLGSKLLMDLFKSLKTYLVVIGVIITTNIFWILPAGYSFLTYSKEVANAKNYQMASNDIFYRNNKHGNLLDLALIKGVVLDFQTTDYKSNSTHYMMWPWLNHISTPFFYIPAWIFFLLALVGLFKSLKNKNLLSFAIVFLFAFFMMGTDIPGISLITGFLRQNVPLFSTIFRFTFTKFSILYVFSYSIMLAVGLSVILSGAKNSAKRNLLVFLFLGLLLSYSFPSFQGHFFYENLAVKIPQEYFQVFNFFEKQDHNERIAILPIPWYWAWLQPKWGTINSGFIWYGIPQSITDLAFTPWGRANENFYWELDQAIFSKNPTLLEKVLNKYDISWIYLDKNILNEPGRKMSFGDYENLLNSVNGLSMTRRFGQIDIFHYQQKNQLNNFVGIKNNLSSIAPKYNYDNYDQAYLDYGDYLTDRNNAQIYYPFRSLFSGKNPQDEEFKVDEDGNFIYFKSELPNYTKKWSIQTNDQFQEEMSVVKNNSELIKYTPKISINDKELVVRIDKNIVTVYQSNQDTNYINQTNNGCEVNKDGIALLDKGKNNGFILTSIGSNNCIKIELPNIYQRFGYLFNIRSISDNKRGLFLNLTNKTTDKIDLETYIQNDGKYHNNYLISSPRGFYDMGYSMYFNNISEGREKVVNTLEEVNIYQIPFYFLKDLKLVNPLNQIKDQNKSNTSIKVTQKNISHYQIKINRVSKNSVLYLSQSYNPGWIAFSNGKILKHVLVNNWANGWLLDSQPDTNHQPLVTIIFWPQYLEFLGFALLIIVFLFILKKE